MSENEQSAVQGDMLTVYELSCVTGLSERIIQRLITLEVLEPDQATPQPCFRIETVTYVRRIRRLHVELGVGWSSIPLVLDLLQRIEELEHRHGDALK